MKNAWIIFSVVLSLILVCPGITPAQDRQTPPEQPENEGGWYCPWCGNPGPGRQMMYHERGIPYGMHEGGMSEQQYETHHGWGRGQCDMAARKNLEPMTQDQVRQMLEHYVAANPNLKVGQIEEKNDMYVGRIVTKDDSLVEKVVVDRNTGYIRREY